MTDPPERDRWVRMRFSIIGPFMAAPPGPQQLGAAFRALTAKTSRHPVQGMDVRFGAPTLECCVRFNVNSQNVRVEIEMPYR
jgi:hypothetical protein